MKTYDVVVIGSGMAGMTIAQKCASKNKRVAVTDSRPYGGTCALRGCDPKKVLLGAAEVVDHARKLSGKGLRGDLGIQWPELMKFKETFTEPVPENIEKNYRKMGIDTFHAPAQFTGEQTLHIGDQEVQAEKVVISTGAKPLTLNIPGEEYALTSTDFLNLSELADEITFIGGGYIAFEFAHLAVRAGAKVNILHRGEYPLENFEQGMVSEIVKASKDLGINLLLETEAQEITQSGQGFVVHGSNSEGKVEVPSGLVIKAAGRVPEIDALDLTKGNVAFGKQGVEVNEYLQSVSNPHVYAAGDAADTSGLPLTPVAVMEGHIVASNILQGNTKTPDYREMPTVVFTIPAMASVGLTEEQAQQQGKNYKVNKNIVPKWYNARRLNEKTYAFKTIVDQDNDTLLGAHLVGPQVEEVINLFAMAIKAKMTTKDLKNMVYAYPTFASDISHMV